MEENEVRVGIGSKWNTLFEVFTKQRIMEELIYGSIAGLFLCIGGHPFE